MPTSFIPKRPVSSDPITPKNNSHATGLLSFVAIFFVLLTIVSYVGVFLYGKQLKNQKAKSETEISEAKNSIGTTFLGDMKRLNDRIDSVNTLINKHIVVTPIFSALEQTTLRSIQYKTFSYEFVQDPTTLMIGVKVTLTGTAKGYPTIALQSDSFTQNRLIKNPVFSALTVDDKSSAVNFKLTFNVDPEALSYEKFISNIGQGEAVDSELGVPVTSTLQ